MQILLACAKTMHDTSAVEVPQRSTPLFEADAHRFALELCRWPVSDLATALQCSDAIARENHLRYGRFADPDASIAAVMAYYGQAYKYLRAAEWTAADLLHAQRSLWICSFLYGLLRPLDTIHPYRLEGKVRLEATGDKTMFAYWRDRLTTVLIDAVRADDGVLLHLATEEMEHLFDWRRVEREVRVVQPLFYADQGHRLKAISVHAKSCRGAMARATILGRYTSPEELHGFAWQNYVFRPDLGDANHPHFISL